MPFYSGFIYVKAMILDVLFIYRAALFLLLFANFLSVCRAVLFIVLVSMSDLFYSARCQNDPTYFSALNFYRPALGYFCTVFASFSQTFCKLGLNSHFHYWLDFLG